MAPRIKGGGGGGAREGRLLRATAAEGLAASRNMGDEGCGRPPQIGVSVEAVEVWRF
jgi:hypothetical protein